MLSTEIQASKVFRLAFLYGYPLLIVGGWLSRLTMGDLSMHDVQNSANTFFIPCIFHWLTDLDCPGCGITRSLVAMFLWSPTWSFYFHPLGPVFAAVALFYWLSLILDSARVLFERCVAVFNRYSVSILLIVFAWGIFRNF